MGKEKADMLFTDPPYNVNYVGKGENTQTGILNDKMDDAKFLQFLKDAFAVVRESMKGGAGMYIFHSDKTQLTFEQAINLSGLEVKNQLIWNKPSGGMGMGDYRSKHEPFFYVTMKGQKPQFYGDRTNVTVVDFQKTDEQLMKWAKQVKEAEKDGKNDNMDHEARAYTRLRPSNPETRRIGHVRHPQQLKGR